MLPFNPNLARENRRKDIPDAWIYQSAIDVYQNHDEFLVLCRDDNLSTTLDGIGENVTVYRSASDVLERLASDEVVVNTSQEIPATDVIVPNPEDSNKLIDFLRDKRDENTDLEIWILGLIKWFDPMSKEDLYKLLADKGFNNDIVENTAQHLVYSGIIKDTGNHYLPVNMSICTQAADLIIADIMKIISG